MEEGNSNGKEENVPPAYVHSSRPRILIRINFFFFLTRLSLPPIQVQTR